jgi:glycosyltransferase involved in cell wall biosynthesis
MSHFSSVKILRIIARLNVGGPARHVVWLTKALQDGEFESLLLAGRVPAGEEDMGYVAEANGVEPVFIEEMSRELSIKDIVSLVKIFRLILREKPDIIHTHTAKAGTVGRSAAFLYRWLTPAVLAGRPRRLKVVHTFHGHVFHSYYGKFKTSLFVLIEKLLARFATDRIVVISNQQFDEIHGQVGIGKKEQFAVVPLGIDLEPFNAADMRRDELKSELAVDSSTILVGFVGRLTEIKNIQILLKVAHKYENLVDPALPRLHFVIAGDGHLRGSLEAEASELGIGNITFLGNREEIEAVYAGLDVVALTSLNEGTPLSLIEAMASGKPVISTTVGGVIDLLGPAVETLDGFAVCERGIGVEPLDPDAFLKGLIYLVKSERLREDLAAKGHDFVHGNYGKDRLTEDIRDLYRGLSGGST